MSEDSTPDLIGGGGSSIAQPPTTTNTSNPPPSDNILDLLGDISMPSNPPAPQSAVTGGGSNDILDLLGSTSPAPQPSQPASGRRCLDYEQTVLCYDCHSLYATVPGISNTNSMDLLNDLGLGLGSSAPPQPAQPIPMMNDLGLGFGMPQNSNGSGWLSAMFISYRVLSVVYR